MRSLALTLALALCSCRSPGAQASPEAAASAPASSAPAAGPASSGAAASPPAPAGGAAGVVAAHLEALHRAGDEGRCDQETARVRASLAADRRLSVADLEAEKMARDPTGKGSMPYPSPGTACAIFGIVKALDGAVSDRKAGR